MIITSQDASSQPLIIVIVICVWMSLVLLLLFSQQQKQLHNNVVVVMFDSVKLWEFWNILVPLRLSVQIQVFFKTVKLFDSTFGVYTFKEWIIVHKIFNFNFFRLFNTSYSTCRKYIFKLLLQPKNDSFQKLKRL